MQPLPLNAPRPHSRRRVLLLLDWYNAGNHRGIARYSREAGWMLDSMTVHGMHMRPIWPPDGVIWCPRLSRWMDALVQKLRAPTVTIGLNPRDRFVCVATGENSIAAAAATHFAERGFKHVAFYYKGLFGTLERQRAHALEQAVALSGRQFHLIDASPLRSRQRRGGVFPYLRRKLAGLPKPVAAMGFVDDIAVEILSACEAEGLRVPEQVAVLGVGNDELQCEFAPVPLSSVDENLEGEGYTAARLLDELMNGRRVPPGTVALPAVGVVTRQSSDILAVEDVRVATVLKTIWQRFREPITAEEVTANVPMCHRRLHDQFVKQVGRSIFKEILRCRLDCAAKLLSEGDRKLQAVARASGFSSPTHLWHAFRREKAITPSQFRRLARQSRS